jgi:hypothetical protein
MDRQFVGAGCLPNMAQYIWSMTPLYTFLGPESKVVHKLMYDLLKLFPCLTTGALTSCSLHFAIFYAIDVGANSCTLYKVTS